MRWSVCVQALVVVILAAGAAASAVFGQDAQGNYWTWTKSAPHHKAIVQVQQASGRGASQGVGCVVWKSDDGRRGIVATCAHAVEAGRTAKIIFPAWDNAYSMGSVIAQDRQADCAIVMVDPPDDIVPVPLIKPDSFPDSGELVEATGYGGPSGKLRHWWARVEPSSSPHALTLYTSVLSGDSGGPVFYHDQLVGVIWGGRNRGQPAPTNDGQAWHLVYPAEAAGSERIREIWKEIEHTQVPAPGPLTGARSATRPQLLQLPGASGATCPPGGT